MSTPKNSVVACWDAGGRRSYSGSGTTWYDISGNKNNGTLENSPTFNAANGGSIVFDGSDDYVTAPTSEPLKPANLTISYWIWYDDITDGTGYCTISHNSQDVNEKGSKFLHHGGDHQTKGTIEWAVYLSSGRISTLSAEAWPTALNWIHVVGIYEPSTSTFQLYVNGKLKSSGKDSGDGTLGHAISYNTDATEIGRNPASGGRRYTEGRIAKVLIYNRALTAAEIRTMFYIQRGRFGA